MNEINESTPNFPTSPGHPDWQRVFNEASEMPPAAVWDAIERKLDNDRRVIVVPFWSRTSSWAWSAAAAIAVLLLGWWSFSESDKHSASSLAPVAQQSVNPDHSGEQSVAIQTPTRVKSTEQPNVVSDHLTHPAIDPQPSVAQVQQSNTPSARRKLGIAPSATSSALAIQPLEKSPLSQLEQLNNKSQSSSSTSIGSTPLSENVLVKSGLAITSNEPSQVSESTQELANNLFRTLHTRPMQLARMYGTQRIVWFQPSNSVNPTEAKVEKSQPERWASVGVMPSSFNPGVRLLPTSVAYGNTFARASQYNMGYSNNPQLSSQPDFSLAYQLSGGFQLNNRWSVETGVSYLEARSQVTSPVQAVVYSLVASNRAGNLFSDALNNSRATEKATNPTLSGPTGSPVVDRFSPSIALLNPNVYDENQSQTLSNNYTFMQVPVQVGYRLRPHKRLSFTLLGGFLTNLFVKNTVNNDLEVGNSDKVYRPITLSASTGMRLRFRAARRWSTSLAGVFQQALQRGTRPGTDLTTRPQTMGVSVGIDYHF